MFRGCGVTNVMPGDKTSCSVSNSLLRHVGLLPYLYCQSPSVGITPSEPVALAPCIIKGEGEKLVRSEWSHLGKAFPKRSDASQATSNFFCCLEEAGG